MKGLIIPVFISLLIAWLFAVPERGNELRTLNGYALCEKDQGYIVPDSSSIPPSVVRFVQSDVPDSVFIDNSFGMYWRVTPQGIALTYRKEMAHRFDYEVYEQMVVLKRGSEYFGLDSAMNLVRVKSPEAAQSFLMIPVSGALFGLHFTEFQFFLLFLALSLWIWSLTGFVFKLGWLRSIGLLLCASFVIRFLFIGFDEFINLWDEQFHAMVAKNMMDSPFTPTLRPDYVPYEKNAWADNFIWIHKQPLFMWQMAISMKIFGLNEIAVRLPGVLIGTLSVYGVYRSGKLLVNERTGFIAASIFAFSSYFLNLLSGFRAVDQNDYVFITYVTLSLWAWLEYMERGKKRFMILLIFFTAAAILTKWLPGLLVFSGWGTLLVFKRFFSPEKSWWPFFKALFGVILLAAPWQIYCAIRWPEEFAYETGHASSHFTEVLDGHEGTGWFHLDGMVELYNIHWHYLVPLLIFALIYILKSRSKKYFFPFAFMLIFPYVFYSMAATKMTAFPGISALIVCLSLGIVIDLLLSLFEKLKSIKWAKTLIWLSLLALPLGFLQLDYQNTMHTYASWMRAYRLQRVMHKNNALLLNKKLAGQNYALLKAPDFAAVLYGFYTDMPSFFWCQVSDVQTLKEKGFKVAVFKSPDLPVEILNDSSVLKLDPPIYMGQ